MVRNSVGTNMFRNFYMDTSGLFQIDNATPYPVGSDLDIAENGKNSCAKFVSSILVLNELLPHVHARVDSTVREMEQNDWFRIENPREGAIVVWKPLKGDDNQNHQHIGFSIGNSLAISNDSRGLGVPVEHDINCHGTTEGGREIEAVYWHEKLKD